MKIDILGTKYKIVTRKISEDKTMEKAGWSGYCNNTTKLIVIADTSEEKYFPDWGEDEKEKYKKKVLRHEIIHAFLNESGLEDSALPSNGSWAVNEEMVDWIALQSPKMYKAFKKAGAL